MSLVYQIQLSNYYHNLLLKMFKGGNENTACFLFNIYMWLILLSEVADGDNRN